MSVRGLICLAVSLGIMLGVVAAVAIVAGWIWVAVIYGISFVAIAILVIQELFEG